MQSNGGQQRQLKPANKKEAENYKKLPELVGGQAEPFSQRQKVARLNLERILNQNS